MDLKSVDVIVYLDIGVFVVVIEVFIGVIVDCTAAKWKYNKHVDWTRSLEIN